MQTTLFDDVDIIKQAAALKTVDVLNSRFGRDDVRIASQGYGGK